MERKEMISPIPTRTKPEHPSERPARARWFRRQFVNTAKLGQIIDQLVKCMRQWGYPSCDLFSIRLCVEEAGVNAIKHGHQGNETTPVWIRYQITSEQVLVEIEDQGPGFDSARIPDPCADANLERCSGRGLLLMRTYTTWLRHNERGNRVTFCRRRSPETE
jgi:anti-sigma regulatory factor (Ser/Thr protein kinase)